MNNELLIGLTVDDGMGEMFLLSPPSTPCTPKVQNQPKPNMLHPPVAGAQAVSDTSTISLDFVVPPLQPVKAAGELMSPPPKSALKSPDIIEDSRLRRRNSGYDETIHDEFVPRQKRQSSTVTYNVNVINFGDNGPTTGAPLRTSGARSNSSTSK